MGVSPVEVRVVVVSVIITGDVIVSAVDVLLVAAAVTDVVVSVVMIRVVVVSAIFTVDILVREM